MKRTKQLASLLTIGFFLACAGLHAEDVKPADEKAAVHTKSLFQQIEVGGWVISPIGIMTQPPSSICWKSDLVCTAAFSSAGFTSSACSPAQARKKPMVSRLASCLVRFMDYW